MAGEIILEGPKATETVTQIQENREASARAAATPLPGALADAFSIAPEIKIGNYSIRPFLEGDFELLQALEHPLYEMLISMFTGKENKSDYFPRGQEAWDVCYIFTHPFDEVEKAMIQGKQFLRDAAKSEFKKVPTAGVLKIHGAIMKQIGIATSTAIAYGAEDEDGSKKNAVTDQSTGLVS